MRFGEQLIAWRRELHQHPELSGQEVETTARLHQWLTHAGITPLPYDLPTGAGGGDRQRQQTDCPAGGH